MCFLAWSESNTPEERVRFVNTLNHIKTVATREKCVYNVNTWAGGAATTGGVPQAVTELLSGRGA